MAYLWQYDRDGVLIRSARVEAEEYWPLSPGIEVVGSRRFIVVAEKYRAWPLPTHEQLENGEIREMKVSRWAGGTIYFNRSRRILHG